MLDPHLMVELAQEIQKERIERAQQYLHAEPAEPILPIVKARVTAFMQRLGQKRPAARAADTHSSQELPAVR